MSEEKLKAFLEKVKGDTSLQEKLKAAADANAVTAIAKEAGFNVSADLITKARSLTEEELEGVAGGGWDSYHLGRGLNTAFCVCRTEERPPVGWERRGD